MPRTPGLESVSTGQRRIAELAREDPQRGLHSLSHHITLDWMKEAYRLTRKDGAPGIDGQTAATYETRLEKNLQDLLDRSKSGRYWAPPVRRAFIPKGAGAELRPIGIPTLEDKVLQRAVVMVLEAVYETDFLDVSYGFRPGRSAHQALEALWQGTMKMHGGWVVDADIRKFFDTLDHSHLRAILTRRIRDGVLLNLIGKWLNAGVLEEGRLTYPESGTPQGGVISPMLANIYLHEVLDQWFAKLVKPILRGPATLIRFADDFVMVFAREDDARRVLATLPKRFAKYGLTLHPEKTRLVPFGRPPYHAPKRRAGSSRDPGTFNFLGFTHYWGRTRKGNWAVQRSTAKDRLVRSLRRIATWCRSARHASLAEQHLALSQKLRGHYAYFGITGNMRGLQRFFHGVKRAWFKWLGRRSQKARRNWAWFALVLEAFPLPFPRIVHSALRAANP